MEITSEKQKDDQAALHSIDRYFHSDTCFDQLYPDHIRDLSMQHWTPLRITKKAVDFLAGRNPVKILDIGSGVGKFALAGAYFKPNARFFGVEQRKHLVMHAADANKILGLKNTSFYQANLTALDFARFDHFYFYNSFYENLYDTSRIDDSIVCAPALYHYYFRQLIARLSALPAGTRLATFHTQEAKIPPSYSLVEEYDAGLLKCWIKK